MLGIIVQNAIERSARARPRHHITGIERGDVRDLAGARGLVELPLAEDVDGEADQFGTTRLEGLPHDGPEPVCGLKDMQCGVNAPARRVWRGRNVGGVMVEAHHIAHGARDALAGAVIGVGMGTFDHAGNGAQRVLVIIVAVGGAPTLDDGNAHVMTGIGIGINNGFIVNSFVSNEFVTNGFVVNRFVVNGFVVNGFVVNGFVVNGFVVNGFVVNGFVVNGFVVNGFVVNGFVVNGF